MSVELIVPRQKDIEAMKGKIRASDREEIWSAYHAGAYEELITSCVRARYKWGIRSDKGMVAIFGVTRIPGEKKIAVPWFIGTNLINKHKKFVAKTLRETLGFLMESFVFLFNYVSEKNKVSLRFLRRLGFKIEPPEPFGCEGENYHFAWIART